MWGRVCFACKCFPRASRPAGRAAGGGSRSAPGGEKHSGRCRANGARPGRPRGSPGRSGGVRSRPPRARTGLLPSGSAWLGLGRFPPGARSAIAARPAASGARLPALPSAAFPLGDTAPLNEEPRRPCSPGGWAPSLPAPVSLLSLSPRRRVNKHAAVYLCNTSATHFIYTESARGIVHYIQIFSPSNKADLVQD